MQAAACCSPLRLSRQMPSSPSSLCALQPVVAWDLLLPRGVLSPQEVALRKQRELAETLARAGAPNCVALTIKNVAIYSLDVRWI